MTNIKDLNFLRLNLNLIHMLQNTIMEDFNFHQYHLSLFVVIKIMKQNNKSTDFERSCLSYSTAACCISPAPQKGGGGGTAIYGLYRYVPL